MIRRLDEIAVEVRVELARVALVADEAERRRARRLLLDRLRLERAAAEAVDAVKH